MTVDYEVEYDNRSRVPEHPEIFARWISEGAAYRAALTRA
jgi:arylformamidase